MIHLMLFAIGIAAIPVVTVSENRRIGRELGALPVQHASTGAGSRKLPIRTGKLEYVNRGATQLEAALLPDTPAGPGQDGPAPTTAMANTPDPAVGVCSATSVR